MIHTKAAQCKQSLVLGTEEDAAWCEVFWGKNTTSSTKVGLRGSAQQPLTPFTEGNKLFGGLGP